jgi:hypothetical protein
MDGTCGTHGDKRNAYRVLVINAEGEIPVRRPSRCGWKDTIKMALKRNGLGGNGLYSSGSWQGQVAGYSEHANESGSINCRNFLSR